ncbi:COMM domain-containing protein 4 [Egretta garzetta]|uniref:COMM domain-containing protein 4 n=1 Tax=Egretta garzetta TaxID=188379 RepID=UPI00163C84B4|nr:COMM domain-containing protein 4 [Egretta garzetta]
MGNPGLPGVRPPASYSSGPHSPAQPVHVLPLWFRLLGIAYTEALSSRASGSYRELEEEVRLMLNQMLSTYETFLQANVLKFMNGSVIVQGEALFRGNAPAPTNSHLIRTVITEARRGRSIFSWQLEPQSVQSGGFSLENLDPEKLSISLIVFQLGRSRTDALERLVSKVTWSLSALYPVRNFTIIQLRNLTGDLEITGDLYLDTIIHADVAEILQALTALTTCSVDLTSLSVEGSRLHLQVYPLSFLITNKRFSEDLLDPLAVEHQELIRDLGDMVARALKDHKSFLQVVIRGFLPGSLICHGDMVYQHPAPTSLEVLEALVLSVGPNKAFAGSEFQVDPYSLAVGEDTLEPPPPEPGFPEYGVAIMVVCGLCIVTGPIVLLVYEKILKLTSDAKLESGDVKATIAVLGFILSRAAKHNVDGESLSGELQQLGLPKEHASGLCRSYEEKQSSLQESLRACSLRLIQLGSVRWRVDFTLSSSELREVNEPLVHLTFNLRDGERGGTAAVPVALSADKLRVLLAGEARGGGGSRDPGPGRGDAPLPPPPPSLL